MSKIKIPKNIKDYFKEEEGVIIIGTFPPTEQQIKAIIKELDKNNEEITDYIISIINKNSEKKDK